MDTYAIIQQSLQNIYPFSEEQVKFFQEHTTVRFLPKNTLLLKPGEVCDFVAIVLEGSLRLFHPEEEGSYKDSDGKKVKVDKAKVDEFRKELTVLGDIYISS